MEGSHSGLVRSLGKRISPQGDRGFESPPLRTLCNLCYSIVSSINVLAMLLRLLIYLSLIIFVVNPFLTVVFPFLKDPILPGGCSFSRDVYGFPKDVLTITYTTCQAEKLETPDVSFDWYASVYDIVYFSVVGILLIKIMKKIRSQTRSTLITSVPPQSISSNQLGNSDTHIVEEAVLKNNLTLEK